MATTEKEYRRLPGRGVKFEGMRLIAGVRKYTTLWMGKDHLLGIYSTGWTEEYRRFYYRDIQALILRRTNGRAVTNFLLGIPMVIGFLLLVLPFLESAPQRNVGRTYLLVFGGIVAFFLIMMLLNLMAGPTCACHIRTAVQVEELPSIKRLRAARKVIARLRPEIEAAQGLLTPEQIQIALAQSSPVSIDPTSGPSPSIVHHGSPRHYHGRAHEILFWLCIADVPNTLLSFFSQTSWVVALNAVLMLATFFLGILALVKQSGTDLPAGLRRIPWIVLGTLVGFFIISFIYGIVLAMRALPERLEHLSMRQDPVLLAMAVVSTAISLTLGLTGLVLLRDFRQTYEQDASSGQSGSGPLPAAL